jgi:cell division protease FtsH
MLARAVAAHAGVDFFAASGSSFVEMFVGRGAARIRRLFKEARKSGRAVIFIDELDAVGGHRGSGAGDGGTSEREQALNQLLVELDGFERDPGTVIVLAASNQIDKLDKALLRPGRFDRQVLVAPPDRDGREAILHSHARTKTLSDKVDLRDVARKTTGLTGAQLANALNEAAIIAGRAGRMAIGREDLDEALLRQTVGSQQSRRLTEEERRIVAYHEAGHALTRRLCGLDPPEILSIVPRGPALGFVGHSPSEDRYLRSRKQLMDEIVILLGGRAAEEEVFDEAYSGAADDLARVQQICVQMVTEFGMTISHGPPDSAPLAQPTGDYAMSDRSRRDVDENAHELAHMAYARARQLMSVNRRCLDDLATNALERETLTREDLDEIFEAHDLQRTLVPNEQEGEAKRIIARDRSRSRGALLPQHSKPETTEN